MRFSPTTLLVPVRAFFTCRAGPAAQYTSFLLFPHDGPRSPSCRVVHSAVHREYPMDRLRRVCTLALILAASIPSAARAQWSTNPSQNTPVCLAIGDQQQPQVASDGQGGALIVWIDGRDPVYKVYAQRMSGNGFPMWDS